MELAAAVVVPYNNDFAAVNQTGLHVLPLRPLASPLVPILGNNVLRTWTDRIHKLNVKKLWLTSLQEHDACLMVRKLFQQGVERLLMIKLKAYAEMDLADLVRFHCEAQNSVTDVEDSQGRLGVSIVNRAASSPTPEIRPDASALPDHATYAFHGYAKRIVASRERQALISDALTGACAMRPSGNEIRDKVWIGKAVRIAESARIFGPTYIGDRTIVRAGAVIGPFASIENDCVVDCATTVEKSTILPRTHLAPGLLIRNALVDGGRLEDLQRGAIADLESGGLAGRTPSRKQGPHVAGELSPADSHAPETSLFAADWREVRL